MTTEQEEKLHSVLESLACKVEKLAQACGGWETAKAETEHMRAVSSAYKEILITLE